ncbi:MAG TPA: SprB repeat-containing protein, partial [Bacteroidia bacterium]
MKKSFLLIPVLFFLIVSNNLYSQLTVSISSYSNVLCNGQCNGSATASATGGFGTLHYTWSPGGATTKSVSGLCAGTYSVHVQDSMYYTGNATVSITQPPVLTSSVTSVTNVACNGMSNGSATIVPSGGSPGGYLYSWNTSPVQTTQTAAGLIAGNYVVTVTDMNGCVNSNSVTISQPTAIVLNSSQTNPSCFGQANGTANINATGGTGAYTYLWNTSPVQTTQSISGLAAGNYTVTVKDAIGCSSLSIIAISQPTALTASISSSNATCFGSNNGTATVSPSGGIPAYSYMWLSGATTQTASNLSAGNVSVTVTDANACMKQFSVTITQPAAVNISISASSYCVNSPVQLIPSGTTTYHWSPSAGLSCITCANPTASPSVTSTYTLTDANGCGAAQITVNVGTTAFPQICMSTVDTNSTHNIIIWTKPASQGTIASFKIYRETATGFTPIATLPYSHLS